MKKNNKTITKMTALATTAMATLSGISANADVNKPNVNLVNFVQLDATQSINKLFFWFLQAGGGIVALVGIIVFFSSSRAGDGEGKMNGGWMIVGGVAVAAAAAITNTILGNPPTV
ncbi:MULTISPECIES: hypothetical protein [Lactococcus]|uniref:Conjugal transfer protein TrbC n=1 Tax=Lactococcus petauri TaxID=1940789 RepID=A0AAJ2J0X2_9LACT|nr:MULTISPECIES: hypothetical protein [Lactococcus]MCO7181333.1 hypothetical protein [Lactococcus formosensis]MDT2527991.1 hypothetical protein [Lactococcus petauri]MDT2542534.1 hypothetical protein [Lactococcus petauri]MDT2552525.1 hypothetical protein [Lactococcus petauri]MDT2559134.1 hypothetical protein [Lactococcus petauri]